MALGIRFAPLRGPIVGDTPPGGNDRSAPTTVSTNSSLTRFHRSSAVSRRWIVRAFFAGALAASATSSIAEEILKNWFDDPYFQVRDGIANCPVPLGPYTNHDQMLHETHYRSERGLRCYLEKKCSKPSSYMYDADIAAAVRSRFESSTKLKHASLWVTVQRRFVWIDGCVRSMSDRREIDKLVHGVPDMELLIVNVMRPGEATVPYRVPGPAQRLQEVGK